MAYSKKELAWLNGVLENHGYMADDGETWIDVTEDDPAWQDYTSRRDALQARLTDVEEAATWLSDVNLAASDASAEALETSAEIVEDTFDQVENF